MTTNYHRHLLIDLNHEEYPYEEDNLSLELHHASTNASYCHLPQNRGASSYVVVESKPCSQQEEVVPDEIPCNAPSKSIKREINNLKLKILKREGEFSDGYNRDKDHHSGEQPNGSSNSSIKWMTSKMRMLKKMMKSDDNFFGREATHNNSKTINYFEDHNFKHLASPTEISVGSSADMNHPTIRFCADCNTTTTPLWRSGPQGPKSLCNACGIRQRKARRAAMAATSGASMNKSSSNKLNIANKETGSSQYTKKRSKTNKKPMVKNKNRAIASRRKLCFEEFALSMSKKLSLHQVFPPDEKEAAILLMAMSCGVVEG